jgi:ATP-dependent Lhr-like helicase
MLERYGILTREMALAEGIPGGFSTLYPELSNLEVLGTARRGYFVEGLGGAQFALSGAVERLRALPPEENGPDEFTVLAATDPASPWGSTLPWPKLESGRKAARTAGAYVLARAGHPLVYLERGGKGILRLDPQLDGEQLAAALAFLAEEANAGRVGQLKIERFDGEPILGSTFEQLMVAAGFSRQPRRLVVPG